MRTIKRKEKKLPLNRKNKENDDLIDRKGGEDHSNRTRIESAD